MVGRSGSSCERRAVLTASPRKAPDSICGLALVATPKNIWVTLPTVAIMPEFTSRYGTWRMLIAAIVLRYSQAMRGGADARRSAVELAGIGLCVGDELAHGFCRHTRMGHERIGDESDDRNGHELLD